MSYRDRLKPGLKLTSPDGDVFNTKWIGDDKSKDKNLGIFNFPDFDGSIIQDLGRQGISYPLGIYFDGPDNDIESERFFKSCDQRGPWEVVHPVDGVLQLQLVSVRNRLLPIDSGNITECRTNWIESTPEINEVSLSQLGSEINTQAENVNESSTEDFTESASQEDASQKIALEKAVTDLAKITQKNASEIISTNGDVFSQFELSYRSIQDTMDQDPADLKVLSGQIQNLVQIITYAYDYNTEAFINMYDTLILEYENVLTEGTKLVDKNIVVAVQSFISSVIVATCQTAVVAELQTRPEAVQFSESVMEIFCNSVSQLDVIQENFKNNDIDMQYFSNTNSYTEIVKIVSKAVKYLLESSLSLKIEKRFILNVPKTPLQITIEEYGSLGENDFNLDFFIKTNMLKGNDIRLLRAGREVVVYA